MTIRHILVIYISVTVGVALFLPGANAAVLYQTAPSGSLNTPGAIAGGETTALDDFRLSVGATITSVSWLGKWSLPDDEYRLGFYESTSQTDIVHFPVLAPFFEISGTAGGTINADDPGTRDYRMDLGSGVFLQADTAYWLGISNITPGRSLWNWKGDIGGFFVSRKPSGDTLAQLTLFFTLEGDIGGDPDTPPVAIAGPPAAALLGLGLIGVSILRRKHPGLVRAARRHS